MGDFERRNEATAQSEREKATAKRNEWARKVTSWQNKPAGYQSHFIFEVTRGIPTSSLSLGPRMEAGFNDAFDLWNYVKHTWGATSNLRNVWANGKNLIEVGDLLRIFPDPQSFAEACRSVDGDD